MKLNEFFERVENDKSANKDYDVFEFNFKPSGIVTQEELDNVTVVQKHNRFFRDRYNIFFKNPYDMLAINCQEHELEERVYNAIRSYVAKKIVRKHLVTINDALEEKRTSYYVSSDGGTIFIEVEKDFNRFTIDGYDVWFTENDNSMADDVITTLTETFEIKIRDVANGSVVNKVLDNILAFSRLTYTDVFNA